MAAYTAEQRQQDIIRGKLAEIELEHDVRILFAVESGSRAWGFPSPDSDYDVRFVYARPASEYARLIKKSDTIGKSAKGAFYDLHGWDIGKALLLALKSNATLLEWLHSPIRYRWEPSTEEIMRLISRVADKRGLTYNYYNLARTVAEQLQADTSSEQTCKKFLYGLRSALCLRWLRLYPHSNPPMNIEHLMEPDLPEPLKTEVRSLIKAKTDLVESTTVIVPPNLVNLLLQEVEHAAETKPQKNQVVTDSELLRQVETLYLKLTQQPC